jgi:hypothetical protein
MDLSIIYARGRTGLITCILQLVNDYSLANRKKQYYNGNVLERFLRAGAKTSACLIKEGVLKNVRNRIDAAPGPAAWDKINSGGKADRRRNRV